MTPQAQQASFAMTLKNNASTQKRAEKAAEHLTVKCGLTPEQAANVVHAIQRNDIPGITIK